MPSPALPTTSRPPPARPAAGPSVAPLLTRALLRPTAARVAILEAFFQLPTLRLGADDMYRQLLRQGDGASRATVYRVLRELEAAKFLEREWIDEGRALYGLRVQAQDAQSFALVCRSSHRQFSFSDGPLREQLAAVVRQFGLTLGDEPITIHASVAGDVRAAAADLPPR